MEIDWLAPFELAWQLGLFLLGSLMVLFVIFTAVIILYGIVRGFVGAMRRAKAQGVFTRTKEEAPVTKDAKEPKKPTLKPVE